jgi:hypothetical protein
MECMTVPVIIAATGTDKKYKDFGSLTRKTFD